MKTLFSSFLIAAVFATGSSSAQTPVNDTLLNSGPPQFFVKPSLTTPPSYVLKKTKTARKFVAFTSKDLANVRIPRGMSEQEYLAKLNLMESELNKIGLSNRDPKSTNPILLGSVKNAKANSVGLQAIAVKPTVVYPSDAVLQARAQAVAPPVMVYSSGGAAPVSTTPCRPSPAQMAIPMETKTASYSYTPIDIAFGDKSTLYAGAFARYELKGSVEPLTSLCYWTATPTTVTNAIKNTNSSFYAYVGAEASIYVLNTKFTLAEASVTLNAPSNSSKKLSKKVVLKRIGKSLIDDFEEYTGDSKTIDKTDKDAVELKLADIIIPIAGPVSVRTTFSLGGSVGIKYLTALNRYGLYSSVTPFLEAHAAFEGAIDLCGIASAGVGGYLTLLDVKVPVSAKSSLSWSSTGWKLENNTDMTINAFFLRGRLYGFAEVDLWLWSHRWEVDFGTLNGTTFTKNLFNVNRTISFPNWRKDLALTAVAR